MVATDDSIRLRKHRRIVWYVIFALLFSVVVLANFESKGANSIAAYIFLLIIPTLPYVVFLGDRIHHAEMTKEEIKLQPYWKILVGNLLFAGTFVLLACSTFAPMAGFAIFVVMGALLPLAVSASFSARKGAREPWRQQLWRQRWTRFLIYAIAVSVGIGFHSQASKEEQRNYDSIIAAVDQYKATESHYPDTLEQLAPKYLTAVPTTRLGGEFKYWPSNPDDAHLEYMPELFLHVSFNFKSKVRKTWN